MVPSVDSPTHLLGISSTRQLRAKENSSSDLLTALLDSKKRQSKRNNGRANSSLDPVDPSTKSKTSNKSKRDLKKNDAKFRHQLMLIDKRLSAVERGQDSIRTTQNGLAEELVHIQHEQDTIGNQLANIAQDQQRIACDQANIRKDFESIGREQDDLEREYKELRLEQEDIRKGFDNTRRKIAKSRRSSEDLRKRLSVVAEDQARMKRQLEDDDETCESFLRALDVFNRVIVEDEGSILDVHFM
ncbi:hypothetical protein AGABI2DRAFT_195478 [Agaricus bisporus var. bisporus H97]|uniref:hypothetical protein n=1 Tax=Agaricus bisporus var. bisporus (strain H97 / ATCC MYA-4626 / FGSC 10389) TaxID=936046 RepID=UPI00029F6DF1|nr:hypothetical protein AGABI2DRAFT_195478 [Agaricus bisporus var. bisporus H97]EKV43317.1 hypothetical protein AGABI2DRAFT_195478 [Agaricus bisporus var. bisporus H97]